MKSRIAHSCALVVLLAMASVSGAAVLYGTAGSTYSQLFDRAAGAAATNPWVNDSTIPGWYAYQSSPPSAVPEYRITSSTSTGIILYQFRLNTASTDHALGTKPLTASDNQANG